jgi:stage V sporulation protein G
MIEITEIRVTPLDDPKLKAYATIVLAGVFAVRGLKIVAGKGGRLFVAMPSWKRRDGGYADIIHPINSEFRNHLEQVVLAEYNRTLRAGASASKGGVSPPPAPH